MGSKLFKEFIKKSLVKQMRGSGPPGPPPRQGLQWKPQTHRWIRPGEVGGVGGDGGSDEVVNPDSTYEDFLSNVKEAGLQERIPGFLNEYKSDWEARDESVRPEWGSQEWADEVGDVTFDIGFAMPEGGDDEDEELTRAEDWISSAIANSGVEGFEGFGVGGQDTPQAGGFGTPDEEYDERTGLNAERAGDQLADKADQIKSLFADRATDALINGEVQPDGDVASDLIDHIFLGGQYDLLSDVGIEEQDSDEFSEQYADIMNDATASFMNEPGTKEFLATLTGGGEDEDDW